MSPTVADRTARRALLGLLDRTLDGGSVRITDPVGTADLHGVAAPASPWLEAEVQVLDLATYRAVLRSGSIGLGLAYADGWWDTPDLAAFLRLLSRSVRRTEPIQDRIHQVVRPVREALARRRRADQDRDRRNISAHYDLGNDFFELLLDETMMYSCGIFPSADASMAEASEAKLDRVCDLLDLSPDDHVLEIGTGWGGFALHAARRTGCRVTTTTISARQFEHARDAVAAAGLEDRVTVLDVDYRDLRGTYDKIVSIEMIEAVDWREHDTFFDAVDRLLAPDGVAVLQAIVTSHRRFDRQKHVHDFIKTVIFPDGCIPSIESLTDAADRQARLQPVLVDDIGLHYAETLRRWQANLEAAASELPRIGLDERFRRLWHFYLALCEAGFDERHITDVHLVLARPGWRLGHAPARRLVLTA